MYVTVNSVITLASLLTALGAFVTLFWKLFAWINHQKEQDKLIAEMKADFQKQIDALRTRHNEDTDMIHEEQTLVVYGLLACLKGLAEQGCDGPVTEAIGKIEKHINQKAHSVR